MARTFKPDEVTFTITAEQDDLPIRGNAIVSGDDDYDELVACGIEADLDAGNEWAWASVKVSASWAGFTGNDYLGACSYKDEAGFREGGYLPQMLEGAVDDLLRQIEEAGWDVTCTEDAVEAAIAREIGKEKAA